MPSVPTEALLILHIVCIVFFLGGQLYYLFITQPASYEFFSVNEEIRYLQNVLKRQNPILLLALCLAVLTGGFMITPLKGEFGADYFSVFGSKLLVKLGFFFVVFFISAYQALSVGFLIRFMDPAVMDPKLRGKVGSVRRRMTVTSVANVALTVYIIYLARHL